MQFISLSRTLHIVLHFQILRRIVSNSCKSASPQVNCKVISISLNVRQFLSFIYLFICIGIDNYAQIIGINTLSINFYHYKIQNKNNVKCRYRNTVTTQVIVKLRNMVKMVTHLTSTREVLSSVLSGLNMPLCGTP